MARAKNKHGLTHQQELFCQYVVDAYGNNQKGILVTAYRMAYNCKSDKAEDWHYTKASMMAKEDKIRDRIEQLREEQARLASITRDQLVSDDVDILNLDPLDLWIIDSKTGRWRLRYLHEIPKKTRRLLKFVRVGKNIVPEVDKDAAKKRLIDILGFAAAKDINLTSQNNLGGELRIGFDD